MDRDRILSVEIMEDEIAREKYGERAVNGVVVFTMKQAATDSAVREVKVVRSAGEPPHGWGESIWKPAIQNGKPVRGIFQIPVVFSRSAGDKPSGR